MRYVLVLLLLASTARAQAVSYSPPGICGVNMSCAVSSLTSTGTVTSQSASGACAYSLGDGALICRGDGSASKIEATAGGRWDFTGVVRTYSGLDLYGSSLVDNYNGSVSVNTLGGLRVIPMASVSLPQCTHATQTALAPQKVAEGALWQIVGAGGTWTKFCWCRWDGTTAKWWDFNDLSKTTGTATVCP